MTVRYVPLSADFSTADAENPEILFFGDSLRVRFKDWQERIVVVIFDHVIAYSWDDGDASVEHGHRDDCAYLVLGSPWLARHRTAENLRVEPETKHFKLCFNAIGVLQVLAGGVGLES